MCVVVAVDITLKFLLLSELEFFKKNGYEVSVVCSPGKWLESVTQKGIPVKQITIKRNIFSPFSDLVSLVTLWLYFKKERFDVVLTFTPKPGLLGQLAAKMAGVPIIVNTIFGFYFHENTPSLKRVFFIFIEKMAARCSSFIFFRNKEDFETSIKEHIGVDAKKEFVGDGIDIAKYNAERFSDEFIQEKKKSLGITANIPVVGIVARLVREKGYMELFEAFSTVRQQFPNAVLLVVGPSDTTKKDSIDPVTVQQHNVVFLGERTDADELYPVMDMFVLPSYREGFPHSVMEASAMSRPVVTTDVRGCRAAIEPGVTGLLVPPRDPASLATAITTLLADPKKAQEMGRRGREKAEREFDKNILLAKMQKRLGLLLGRK